MSRREHCLLSVISATVFAVALGACGPEEGVPLGVSLTDLDQGLAFHWTEYAGSTGEARWHVRVVLNLDDTFHYQWRSAREDGVGWTGFSGLIEPGYEEGRRRYNWTLVPHEESRVRGDLGVLTPRVRLGSIGDPFSAEDSASVPGQGVWCVPSINYHTGVFEDLIVVLGQNAVGRGEFGNR